MNYYDFCKKLFDDGIYTDFNSRPGKCSAVYSVSELIEPYLLKNYFIQVVNDGGTTLIYRFKPEFEVTEPNCECCKVEHATKVYYRKNFGIDAPELPIDELIKITFYK